MIFLEEKSTDSPIKSRSHPPPFPWQALVSTDGRSQEDLLEHAERDRERTLLKEEKSRALDAAMLAEQNAKRLGHELSRSRAATEEAIEHAERLQRTLDAVVAQPIGVGGLLPSTAPQRVPVSSQPSFQVGGNPAGGFVYQPASIVPLPAAGGAAEPKGDLARRPQSRRAN